MKKLNLAVVGVLSLGMCVAAEAAITVNPLIVFFSSKNTVQDISVNNTASTTAYVAVTPSLVQNPGTSSESLTAYQTGANAPNFGLMVSPLKMAISANAERKVRLVALKTNPSQDVIYYLNVNQVASLMDDQSKDASGTNIQMSNQISYRVQAVILPANPQPVLSAVRNGSSVTIKNTGNSYASLRDGQLCNTSGNDCVALPSALSYKVLYAGNTWTFNLPKPGVVKFTTTYAEDKKMATVSN